MASLDDDDDDDDDDFSILPSNDSPSSNPNRRRRHGPPPPPYAVVRDKSTVDDSDVAAIAASYNSFDSTATDPNDAASKDLTDTAAGATSSYGNSRRSARYTPVSGSGRDYRKDREEWSDFAIACLLDTYLEKLKQLSRGNLRGRDWEEVAAVVSERSEKERKSVEQCKNKVDNLKKRFKLERHRMLIGNSPSNWPWFKRMDLIVGNSPVPPSDDDVITPLRSKRNASAINSPTPLMIKQARVNLKWQRVVFKISGAALAGTSANNIDPKLMMLIAREVAAACDRGVEVIDDLYATLIVICACFNRSLKFCMLDKLVAIVVGGRNFFCGNTWVNETGLDRSIAYQTGMMTTVMNSILLQSAFEKMGIQTRVQSAFSMPDIAEPYNRQRAIRHLEKGRVVIFAGIGAGSGNPLFTTDTAAALRASEIHAEAVLKGTNVDGVYDRTSQDNNFTFQHISFRDLVVRGEHNMDTMALTLCEDNRIPVVIFNLLEAGNISKALRGEQVGTLIDHVESLS